MAVPRGPAERRRSFRIPSCIHASQTVIYAPQYFINAGPPPQGPTGSLSFAPTVVSFPITPSGQTQFTTYLSSQPGPYYGPSSSISANRGGQVSPRRVYQDLKPTTALSTYRFPPSRQSATITDENNRIVELPETNEAAFGSLDNDSDHMSDTDIPVMPLDDIDDPLLGQMLKSLLPAPHEVVRRTSVRAVQSSTRVIGSETKLLDKTGTLPPSILLLRRSSSCAQPNSPPLSRRAAVPRSKKGRPKHACLLCNQVFSRAHDLKRHNTIHETYKAYPCPHCSKAFGRKDALKRHLEVRGPFHNDRSKKAASKTKPSAKLPSDDNEEDFPHVKSSIFVTEAPGTPAVAFQIPLQSVRRPSSDCTSDGGDATPSRQPFRVADLVPSISSRASSIYTDTSSEYVPGLLDVSAPFNIDRKSSVVQGLPSAHLQLDADDPLHSLMTDLLPPPCGL